MTVRRRLMKAHPATLILFGFLLAIITGTLLLKLPISTRATSISWIDALFTATSAVCVTGLIVVDTGHFFSLFGQCVILALIQIGGLGIMTVSVAMFRWFGHSVSFRYRMAVQDMYTHTPREDIFSVLKSIFIFTVVAETMGTLLLTIHWHQELPWSQAVYTAAFHSISAFCNAGFALFPDSMMRYSDSFLLNATVCSLIVFGGIGFPVIYDIRSAMTQQNGHTMRLSIQTKSVLITTVLLILGGAAMFALLESNGSDSTDPTDSLPDRILIPVFQSVTCRTAGFNTVDIASLKTATLVVCLFLMFIGASPGSCGGGVKTTTLAILAAFTINRFRRKKRVSLFKKSIPTETVTRSFLLVLLSIGIIGLIMFLILAGDALYGKTSPDQSRSFLAVLFETVSAFGTVGLSMGITPNLGAWGKSLIIVTMIIGRAGVLTVAYIFAGTGNVNGIEYSEENMMVG
ncbi:ATPase [bacterium]|nr:ATPase [candidate division CSSED10-310 bacterium]